MLYAPSSPSMARTCGRSKPPPNETRAKKNCAGELESWLRERKT